MHSCDFIKSLLKGLYCSILLAAFFCIRCSVIDYILQVAIDEAVDEMASYFNRETVPKIIITTSDRPSQVRCLFMMWHKHF